MTITPHGSSKSVTLHHGDCLDILAELPDSSVDSIVTDPPYGLGFMGQKWDTYANETGRAKSAGAKFDHVGGNHNPSNAADSARTRRVESKRFGEWCELWTAECLRVLKPGGHLLAFGGTRTWHRLACAVEDAGFEVRDSIAWMYGQGFPKSLDVSKALNDRRCRCDVGEWPYGTGETTTEHGLSGVSGAHVPATEGTPRGAGTLLLPSLSEQGAPTPARPELRPTEDGAGEPRLERWRDAETPERELRRSQVHPLPARVPGDGASGRLHHGASSRDGSVGRALPAPVGSGEPQGSQPGEQLPVESGALPVERGSQAWGGWPVCERCSQPAIPDGLGTAAKPAFEPIVVARKPLVGTVAGNVLAWGTGALNVDGCRVEGDANLVRPAVMRHDNDVLGKGLGAGVQTNPAGRWPANVVLDESQAAALDQQSGASQSRIGNPRGADSGDGWGMTATGAEYDDAGGASRFFYVAKADASERVRVDGVAHPTVKPLALMRWLVRLVTPPGGTVLEPFAGSGTTVEACILEGFRCIAIEREADYLPLIVQRINRRRDPVAAVLAADPDDGGLFDLLSEETA